MPVVSDVVAFLDRFAPPKLAADWDNTGLLLGDLHRPADRLLTCLTVTPDVVAEAVADGAQMIVTHHPILFRGAKKLSSQTPEGKLLGPLLAAGIAVYSPHTAFDNCPGGINDFLAAQFGLTDMQPLRPKDGVRQYKLVVFVPEADLAKVSDAVFAAGGGIIGAYEQCSFRTPGTGTFFGTAGANPTIGQAGQREEAPELRLEILVPEGKIAAAVRAMRSAHSYEEPAFDVYPLRPTADGGEGRIGRLAEPTTLAEFARRVKAACRANVVQYVGPATKPVQIVAVACGAAGEFLADAVRAKADVFVTGEVRFHDCLTAEAAGVGLVLPGHYASERPAVERLAERLAHELPGVTAWASVRERDPLCIAGAC
ncbi:MAG: Nif3-like dinuclear metal center hexameric protein [Fimbriiglobus sp.]|jgi:dinuclear metal center YbgI/SA1388 family protein|nr:Nif3-like dinuclear metal center hexameric protein [Fimbriiglobus sp.]